MNIPEEFQIAGTDIDIMNKLKEDSRPVTNYICFELGWAEYILIPEFFYLDNPDMPGTSLTYLAIWKYAPLISDNKQFLKKFYCFIGGCALLLLGIIGGLIYYFI